MGHIYKLEIVMVVDQMIIMADLATTQIVPQAQIVVDQMIIMVDLATTQIVQQAQIVVDQMIIMANLETILLQDLKLKLAN